jgi:A/G-specific adenine glycosylase
VDKLSLDEILAFRKTILDYYTVSERKFPWRETVNPYHILVSEMMLQQTQTERVLPKYLEWLTVFPDAETLASAPLSAVLERWAGLGYNRRARFLHEACKIIVSEYKGIFPSDPDALDALPGIGPYTARAISTFAFGIPNVFIETNIRSVYIFFFFSGRTDVSDREILELIGETLDADNPRIWYYALMDYGSTLKKKVGNPNRNSLHYAKQSRFEGSQRQARGAVIRYLNKYAQATVESISETESIPKERIESAVRALQTEGLVAEKDGIYRIS